LKAENDCEIIITFHSDEEMKLIDEEIKILKDLNNHFILKYFDSFVVTVPPASKILYLVTEFSQVFIFIILIVYSYIQSKLTLEIIYFSIYNKL